MEWHLTQIQAILKYKDTWHQISGQLKIDLAQIGVQLEFNLNSWLNFLLTSILILYIWYDYAFF